MTLPPISFYKYKYENHFGPSKRLISSTLFRYNKFNAKLIYLTGITAMKHFTFLIYFLITSLNGIGQIAQYSFDKSTSNKMSLPPDDQPINGNLSDVSRGTGVSPTPRADKFSSKSWSTDVLDPDDYYTFIISSNSGFELTLTSIVFDERRSGSGIRNISVRSSLDEFEVDLVTINVPDNTNIRNQTVNLDGTFSNLSNSESVEFRIYGYSAESASGTWWVDNIKLFGVIAAPDTEPPGVTLIEVLSSNSIKIDFNEGVDQSSSENVSNYILNENINPVSASRQIVISQVTLIFTDEFADGILNNLVASNIKDLAGNNSTGSSEDFIFNLISKANFKDIVINEIMADPTPVVGLVDAEYVELFNASTKKIDLKNYTLNDDVILTSEHILLPGEHVVLTDDSNAGLFTGDVIEMPTMGALTNSGEKLVLRDEDSSLDIDTLTYDTSWYGDSDKNDGGYSLERVGPITPCGENFSWKASQNQLGGTPGLVNSVAGSTIETPEVSITMFQTINNQSLQIEFSIAPTNVVQSNDISVPGLNVESIQHTAESNSITIQFSEKMTDGTFYNLTISRLTKCDGAVLDDFAITFGEGATPGYNDLLITEIMANPNEEGGLPEAEYLEIFNPTKKTISLEGIELSDISTSTNLPASLIAPDQYLILTPNSSAEELSVYGDVVGVSNWPSLNNAADVISLSINNDIVFSISYKETWYKDSDKEEGGWSLEMIDITNPCGRIENWSSSGNVTGGSPGSVNSILTANPDNFGPKLVDSFVEGNQVSLRFSEKLRPDLNSIDLSIEPPLVVETSSLSRPSDVMIVISTQEEIEPKTIYEIQVGNITDCLGNLIQADHSSATFTQPENGDPFDVVINEILFNPRPGGVDFVEIFNRSDKYINLKNWSVGNKGVDSLNNQMTITEDNLLLSPASYVVLTEDPVILKADYSMGDGSKFIGMDLPAFPNDQGNVTLIDQLDNLIDSFDYDEALHLSLLDDFEGVSLERVSKELPNQNPDNWKSAASTVGFATPGRRNSQLLESVTNSKTLSVSPQVIIPDNNGIADFATIHYTFQNGNNIASVSIFDAFGRPVKRLIENASIPATGFITWDGTNDRLQKVRIGYYIIHFEVYDAAGNVRILKDRIAVGTPF